MVLASMADSFTKFGHAIIEQKFAAGGLRNEMRKFLTIDSNFLLF